MEEGCDEIFERVFWKDYRAMLLKNVNPQTSKSKWEIDMSMIIVRSACAAAFARGVLYCMEIDEVE